MDHVADIRMEVHGKSMEELFAAAALGLTDLLTAESADPPDTVMDLTLEADDHEQLLVDWLREVLFQNQVRGFVLIRADITRLSDSRLAATLKGRSTRPEDPAPELEVKGITYHGLSIRQDRAGYSARIIFDI